MTAPSNPSSNRVAIVTGAASGIGRSIALRLARDGHDVAVTDLPGSTVPDVVKEIEALGRKSKAFYADVTKEAEVKKLVDDAAGELGSVDIMVANAGIYGAGTVLDTNLDAFEKIMHINATGVFLCYKYAGLKMVEQGRGGRIIGASSLSGKTGFAGDFAYCASKFAVRGMTQAAAQELAKHKITVNSYAPGPQETPLMKTRRLDKDWDEAKVLAPIPMGRLGDPEEVASCVSWLASENAGFVTGQTISINGGQYCD
ncbi:NAD(P)-binding protein [Peniophora sp. CONT]|nr:NAD(P)-binding protein [Peniophora sp. CONT]